MQALKSTSNQIFGKALEDLAATYLINKGYSICNRSLIVASVQVDLLLQSKKFLNSKIIIEVKSDPGISYRDRIKNSQIHRLKRAAFSLSQKHRCEVQIWVVFIDIQNKGDPKFHFIFLATVDGTSS